MDNFSHNAYWIGAGKVIVSKVVNYESPATELRREFILEKQPEKAVCVICGLGAYELFLNGQKVNDDLLSPGFTMYDRRVLYLTYSVEKYLKAGINVVGVRLGDGFYNQTTEDTWDFFSASWRDTPKLLFTLYADSEEVLVSDKSWSVNTEGACYHNAIRTGEYYDARKESDWLQAGGGAGWKRASRRTPPGGILERQTMPPVRICERIRPIGSWKNQTGTVYDFGVNISGFCEIRVKGSRGQKIVMRYAECLNGRELDQSNISCYVKSADFSQDRYTLKGEGTEVWHPKFVYHGFRYVEIQSPVSEELSVTACFVHTDLQKRSDFYCSDDLLNWIYEAGNRSVLSNYHSIPEDCPHREKNGWTGDSAISCDHTVVTYDMEESYLKWLKDLCDCQRENGQLPGIAPTSGWGYNWGSGPAWDAVLFFLPYTLYKETGSLRAMRLVYPYAKKYLQYALQWQEEGLFCYGLADWCPPSGISEKELMSNELSDSCYCYRMFRIAGLMAEFFEPQAKGYFEERAAEIKGAIRRKYIRSDGADNNSQGALAEVLYFGITEGEETKRIADLLARKVAEDKYCFKVGILGMKALLRALSENGHTEAAYKMVSREDYPSYGYWRRQGATTLWENWENTGSHNHHMYSDVLFWLYTYILGVRNEEVAYKKIVIAPYFFDVQCKAGGKIYTPYGDLLLHWQRAEKQFSADIFVPKGTIAVLALPENQKISLESGKMNHIMTYV